nr:hypothetical protein [Candidatus Sigynarchaeota archaeon]
MPRRSSHTRLECVALAVLGVLAIPVRAIATVATTGAEQYYPQAFDAIDYIVTFSVTYHNGNISDGPFWLVNASGLYYLRFCLEDINAPAETIAGRCESSSPLARKIPCAASRCPFSRCRSS